MVTRKRKQKQTLKEFKAWLQGVEELQADDWSPNYEQWQLIRDRIAGIIEEKKVVEKVEPQPVLINPAYSQHGAAHGTYIQPPAAGGLPVAEIEMTPAARKMLNPGTEIAAKTPDIDASNGPVNSAFE